MIFFLNLVKGNIVKWLWRRPVVRKVLGSNPIENTTFHSSNCFCFSQILLIFGYTCPKSQNERSVWTLIKAANKIMKKAIMPGFEPQTFCMTAGCLTTRPNCLLQFFQKKLNTDFTFFFQVFQIEQK